MSLPRYRTLDGVDLDLPVYLDCWVLVPRALARSEPELTWGLDYDDAPPISPQVRDELGGDPGLDFSDGSLLVPIDRWNERAAAEPALTACISAAMEHVASEPQSPADGEFGDPVRVYHAGCAVAPTHAGLLHLGPRVARAGHAATRAIGSSVSVAIGAALLTINALALLLAISFAVAVGQWVLPLRDGMSSAEAGSGGVLLLGAMVLSGVWGLVSGGRSGDRVLSLGAAAHAIFSAGAMVVAAAFAVFVLGFGP